MSAKELQMEMERRIGLISPDLLISQKPTSDTLFSFLNAAQDRFVKLNYIGDDQTVIDTHSFIRNIDTIKSLLIQEYLEEGAISPEGFIKYELPTQVTKRFFLYVSSSSEVSSTYKGSGEKLITNRLIKPQDLDSYKTTAFNQPIIREPGAVLISDPQSKQDYLLLAIDKYTSVERVMLTYYRQPLRFNTIYKEGVIDTCELPESTHSEIVDMAVEMFITEAKYRLNTKQSTEQK